MARERPPISLVVSGTWDDGDAVFDTGNPARDEAMRRVNRSAVMLRARRQGAHLSVETVARWAGLRRQTISDFENGQSWADAITVHQIATVLALDSELRLDPRGSMGPRA
jgi:DNA-binding XRE family transcriptional regulator